MSLDNLPAEWLLTSIENIAEVIAGGTPKANDPENFVEPPNGIGWLTPADLSGYTHKYIGHGKRDLSEKGYKSSSAKLMPKGSVVFSSRAPIGYVAIASNEISTNQGFKNFVIDENISSEYLYYYLKSIRDLAESLGTGTTFKELSGSACKKLPFVLAPLAEQQEIVRQLDVMLAQVEQIKARLDAIPAILKKFRQSVLASYFPENPISSEYVTCNLKDICTSISDGDHQAPPKAQTGIPFLVISDVSKEEVNLDSASRFVPQSYYDSLKDIRKPKKGDILYTVTGSFGIPIPLKKDEEFCFQRHIAILKLNKLQVEQQYLYYLLKSEFVYQQADKTATGTAQKTVALSSLRNFTVHIPSLAEQSKILKSIQGLFEYADSIEQTVQSAQKRVNLLTQSILAKAFSGELTAEWREQHQDLITGVNSAESLLAKIQAEREASKPVKKTRVKKEA